MVVPLSVSAVFLHKPLDKQTKKQTKNQIPKPQNPTKIKQTPPADSGHQVIKS